MWNKAEEGLPSKVGFYLCLSTRPYTSWSFIGGEDRYEDCIIYAFFTGTRFDSLGVAYWLDTPERPLDWRYDERVR